MDSLEEDQLTASAAEDTGHHNSNRCNMLSLSSSTYSHSGRARIAAVWELVLQRCAVASFARRAVNVVRIAANAGSCYGTCLLRTCTDHLLVWIVKSGSES